MKLSESFWGLAVQGFWDNYEMISVGLTTYPLAGPRRSCFLLQPLRRPTEKLKRDFEVLRYSERSLQKAVCMLAESQLY